MSVASSKKGIQTRKTIIDTTKSLFYEKGYANTSIKDICELADVKPGTFTYYFSTKDDLVRELYESVFTRCYEHVDLYSGRALMSLEKNTMVAFPYFYGILTDEKTRAFHYEILKKGSVGDYIYQAAFPISRLFLKEFNLSFSEKELQDIDMAENGLSRELVMDYLNNPECRTIIDLVNTIYIFRARLFTIEEDIMKIFLYNAMEFERTYDHSHITLLK